jgi:hypothetical protein
MVEEQRVPPSASSDWAIERLKNFCHVVGLSCDVFEDKMLVLFSAIKASRHQNIAVNASYLSFKPGNIGNHELKRLICSVNYDMKGGHSGVLIVSYETQDSILECKRAE